MFSFRGDPKAFTLQELLDAPFCVHSFRRQDCASCVRGIIWYEGRIAGLDEIAKLLATNSAIRDSLANALEVTDTTRHDPGSGGHVLGSRG